MATIKKKISELPEASNLDGFYTLGYQYGTSVKVSTQTLKGNKGDTGNTGLQGPKGDTGQTGPKGDTGPQGTKGDKGDTGVKGDKGDNVSIAANDTYITWRIGEGQWQNLVALSTLKGADGQPVQLRKGTTGIEWKIQGAPDSTYQTVVSYSDLKLKYTDLSESDISELQAPATEAAALANAAATLANAEAAAATTAAATATTAAENANAAKNDALQAAFNAGEAAEEAETQAGRAQALADHPDTIIDGQWWRYDMVTHMYENTNISAYSPSPVIRDGNWWNWDFDLQTYVDSGEAATASVDLEDVPVSFEVPETIENLGNGDFIPVAFGKIYKWFDRLKDLGSLAWKNAVSWTEITGRPSIPTRTSDLENDSNFQSGAQVATNISTHDTDSAAHAEIRSKITDVEAIARGKSRAHVFQTKTALDAWLTDEANRAGLQAGDNLYIIDRNVPDYWWTGTGIEPLEAEKVDLSQYPKTTEVQTMITSGVSNCVVKETGKGLYPDTDKTKLAGLSNVKIKTAMLYDSSWTGSAAPYSYRINDSDIKDPCHIEFSPQNSYRSAWEAAKVYPQAVTGTGYFTVNSDVKPSNSAQFMYINYVIFY